MVRALSGDSHESQVWHVASICFYVHGFSLGCSTSFDMWTYDIEKQTVHVGLGLSFSTESEVNATFPTGLHLSDPHAEANDLCLTAFAPPCCASRRLRHLLVLNAACATYLCSVPLASPTCVSRHLPHLLVPHAACATYLWHTPLAQPTCAPRRLRHLPVRHVACASCLCPTALAPPICFCTERRRKI